MAGLINACNADSGVWLSGGAKYVLCSSFAVPDTTAYHMCYVVYSITCTILCQCVQSHDTLFILSFCVQHFLACRAGSGNWAFLVA